MSTKSKSKILVIAEKPSVAADFVRVLGDKFKKFPKYWEGEHYVISYAVGHLVTIADPASIDERYKAWRLDSLPIIPKQFQLEPIEENRAQLSALGKLIRRCDVKMVVNACDAGREGELIFRYILEFLGQERKINKPTMRLWLQSMTAESIRAAFQQLRPSEELTSLADAAISRSEADWLIGINGSRGLTAWNSKGGGFFLTPCGRVQTPTLSMIVDRERERLAFISRPYWTVDATFDAEGVNYVGRWVRSASEGEGGQKENQRIWSLEEANDLVRRTEGKQGLIQESSKPQSERCPALYDLTSLQREANNRFGFSAKNTLAIAQALYERHKALTYPRTDSRLLPEDYVGTISTLFKKVSKGNFGRFASEALEKGYIKKDRRVFDNSKVRDHHAIIPTGTIPTSLSEAEQKIYDMVLQRTIAIFYPPAEYLNTSRLTTVEGELFKTEGKVLLSPGWKVLYGKTKEENEMEGVKSQQALLLSAEIKEEATKPLKRYTEATLLSAMESAGKFVEDGEIADALKERGLGTPATRAAIIEKLITDKYLLREGRDLVPTRKAFDLLGTIAAMGIEELSSPELTGEWEQRLKKIERAEISRDDFMEGIRNTTREIVDKISGFDEQSTKQEALFSPVNGKKIYEFFSHFEEEGGTRRVRKILGGRHLSQEEVKTLYEKGEAGPFHDFLSRKGAPFSALIRFDEAGKITFVFESNTEESAQIDTSTMEPLGYSPIDGSPVYEGISGFLSQSMIDGDPKGLRISRTILGKSLNADHVRAMLNGEKTELITGFRSSRTYRLFDAYLSLDQQGKIAFSFPPRRVKGRRKKGEPVDEEA